MDMIQTAGKEQNGQQYGSHAVPLTMEEVITVYSRTVYAIAVAKTGTRGDGGPGMVFPGSNILLQDAVAYQEASRDPPHGGGRGDRVLIQRG